ncbi:signal peptidase I [Wallemia mellicola]|uniref:Signal peptidase complex catalytic subunit SEC11 n=2 Tax=Wallemia mellicola TaxID=1708541 RepID=I4YJY2_WALMC|nr:signal peptidase I [Wallemia mellicola CBS 633.66]EIM24274.1 signal peptidase I [Wallemia mellicola CBS 633.66]TIB82762.1 signal peptidase I [Wallemia mellicola]TIC12267.1 signal peptidase I [Wallemia mellicola]|eukprot:XP_006956089.1 signal peptidase I [Wallemia mellicola CBS 633.66]
MLSQEFKTLKNLGFRHCLLQALSFASVICTALSVYKGLGVVLNTESPIVVVLSESMEPAFARGDILFLYHPPYSTPIKTGEITVYKIPNSEIPIVHRVIDHHISTDGDYNTELILTKGDNNPGDDTVLYKGKKWLKRDQIVGKVMGYIPYAGYITILMNDHPNLKYAGMAIMALFVMLKRE